MSDMACDRIRIAYFIALGIGCRGFGAIWAALLGIQQFRVAAALALLIFYRHSANISRIIAGPNPRLAHQNPDFGKIPASATHSA